MYKVLIAEDELFVRLGIKNSIPWEQFNMQVVYDAEDGQTAWEKILEYTPDIVITDILMPGLDGHQLIQKLRETLLDPYIIVVTCMEDFELVKSLLSLGVRDYILKATMTEEEIEKCLKKAQLNLQRTLADQGERQDAGFVNKSDQCSQAVWRYLQGQCSREQALAVLTPNHIHLEGASLAVALGQIEAVGGDPENSPPVSTKNICRNLFDLLLNRSYTDRTHYTFFLEENRFLIVLCCKPGTTREEQRSFALRVFTTMHDDIQDYLNIRVSFLLDLAGEGLPGLRARYAQMSEAVERRYLDGMSSVACCWENDTGSKIDAACRTLAIHSDWIAHSLGRVAAEQYSRLISDLRANSGKSREEMTFSLLAISHFICSFFQEHLRDEKRQCDKLLVKYNYLPEGIAALATLLQSGEQYYLLHQKSHYRREIEEALRLIDAHMEDPELSLGFISEQVGLSEAYFSTLFRQELEQTFVKYLSGVRIERAKSLLKQTDMKIFDIALRTGFSDEAYFSRVFKKATGISPSEWRTLWYL